MGLMHNDSFGAFTLQGEKSRLTKLCKSDLTDHEESMDLPYQSF